MRHLISTLALTTLIATSAFASDNRLEPAINGQVSASGNFATQAEEDQYLAAQRSAAEHALEPCINGNVSPSGRYPSPELEEAAKATAKIELPDALKGRTYAGTAPGAR